MTIESGSGAIVTLGDRRILQPGRWRWARALAWMVGLVFLIALSLGPGMEAIQHLLPRGDPRFGFVANVSGAALALAAYALFVRLGEDRVPDEIALRPAPLHLLAGLAIGALMFMTVMGIMAALGLYQITWHGPAPAWHAGGIAIQSGFIEEIIVRGVILRLLWRAFGPLAAFIVSAALFGIAHLFNPGATIVAALCVALEAGVMLGAFYALTGRLWVSIGVHVAWNFTQGYLFGAVVSGGKLGPAIAQSIGRPGAAAWQTGGAFGPEASLPALLVCSGVGLAVLWSARKAGRFEAAPI